MSEIEKQEEVVVETPKKTLSKKDIWKVKSLRKQLVDVPEWGGSIWVREMTGESRAEYDKWLVEKGNVGGMKVRIVIATAIDEDGKPMFNEIDIPDLLSKSHRAIERIANVGADISGLTFVAREEVRKNSETAPKEDLLLDSQKS